MVTGTPWNPRPGEVVARQRYITRVLVERYGPTEDCGACFRKISNTLNDVGLDLISCAQERRTQSRPEPRRGSQLHQIQQHRIFVSTSAAAQAGGVDTEVMESEDIEPAVSSEAHATAAPIRPFVTGSDETMEQEGPESKRQRTVAGIPACSLLIPVDEIPVGYVATHERDDRPVYDHKTGERLSSTLGEGHDAMTRHQLFERVPIAMLEVKKVRCQWLDEMKEEQVDHSCATDSLLMEVAHGVRFDTFAGTAPLQCIKISISRAASITNKERTIHSCARLVRHHRFVLACTVARGRADCNVSTAG